MHEGPAALDKLYSMLHEADTLGLSRPARLRLIGIIGSLEDEELERFRDHEKREERPASERHGSRFSRL
jgi:hypothetical protein